MKFEITNDGVVRRFPMLMRFHNDIVLVQNNGGEKYQVTFLTHDLSAEIGKSWESDLKDAAYASLPEGFSIKLTN